jgi:hypothetical protein
MAPPAIIDKSSIHKNLDQQEMFKEAWWLQYCCCGGRAIGGIGEPLFGSEARNLCLHSTCEMTGVGDPFCSGLSVMCCITQQCAFPKIDGSPTCACCNKTIAGGSTDGWKPALFEFKPSWTDQFWLYYFLCGGVAVHGFSNKDRPIFGSMRKQLCIKEAVQCVAPVQEGTYCSGLGTGLCFWNQCQLPPAENNPKFACCGWKMNKGVAPSGKPAPLSYGKPGQQEMN